MAARTAPSRTAAQHQSLLHFVGIASWSDEKVLAKVREMVPPSMERQGPIEVWIIDDTGFPKQGKHSVGVQHLYCGQLPDDAARPVQSVAIRQILGAAADEAV
jgi:SRSO17 transposase